MANRRKKKAKGRRGKEIQAQSLPVLGEIQLEKHQFGEAIKTFRQLLKNDDDKRWIAPLSLAYRGRIDQLKAKGMAKEALVIYANMVDSCSVDDHHLYMNLLLNCGRYEQAFEMYSGLAESLSKNECHAVEEIFAALILSGTEQILSCLPEDSLIKTQYPHANHALICYCQGDFAGAESHLQNISFRSPYRNLRLALKGMLTYEENHREATAYLNKIDENSVFHHWSSSYRHLSGTGISADNLSRTEKQIVQILEGVDKDTKAFIDGICSRQDNPVGLYSFLINKERFLSREKLQNLCLRILPHAPQKYSDHLRRFGDFSEIQFEKINALISEVEHLYWYAADHWQSVLEILEENNNPADNLKIAILCRHCAELLHRDRGGSNTEHINDLLEKSLEYDPHDRDAYFMLISSNSHNLSQQYKVISRAIDEFPEDIEVLFIAIEAAIGRGAFKKASRIAAKLLEIDPINSEARLLLINTHLDHGRKLACNGKFNLVVKECGAASSYDRANLSQGEIEIFHGLTLLLSGDKDKGLLLHDEGIKKAGSLLLGSFQVCFEARLLEMPVKWVHLFDKNLRVAIKTVPDRETFLALITKIQRCKEKNLHQLEKVKAIAIDWLKKGVKLELSRDDFLFICSVFHHYHYYDLLQVFGKRMNLLWPGMPLGTFYHIYGLSENGGKQLSITQLTQLSDAMKAAMEQGDPKTGNLIDDLLQTHFERVKSISRGIGNFSGKSFEELGHMLGNGEIDQEDFLRFCEETSFIDELVNEMDEIFKMPPQASPKEPPKKIAPDKDEKKTNPKQLNLFK